MFLLWRRLYRAPGESGQGDKLGSEKGPSALNGNDQAIGGFAVRHTKFGLTMAEEDINGQLSERQGSGGKTTDLHANAKKKR